MFILGASGVYAVQMDEPAALPLDLAAEADSGAWARESATGQVIRYRIRLQGPGTDARLAVLTTPAEALAGIECPKETRSSAPVPKGAGVCMIGALPAEGGSVDVLLAVPRHPRDITVSALARTRGLDGKMVKQQARGTIKSSDAAMRPGGGVVGGPETLERVRVAREAGSAETRTGVGAPGAASMVLKVPQTAGEAEGVPLPAPGTSEAQKAEQRVSAFLLDLLGKSFALPAPKPGAAGTSASGTAGFPAGPGTPPGAGAQAGPQTGALPGGAGATGGPAASHETRATVPGTRQEAGSPAAPAAPGPIPGEAAAAGRPAGPVTPGLPPEGTRLPEGAATTGTAPEAGTGVPGQGQAAVPPAGAPAAPTLQEQNGRNHSAVGSQAGHKAAGRKVRGQRHAAGRAGARERGVSRQGLRHAGPGQLGVGQPVTGLPGVPQLGPGQQALPPMGPVHPGSGQKVAGRPGARQPVVGPMVPGYPGVGQLPAGQPVVPGQPGARPQNTGQPMLPGYPGIGQPGMGQPGMAGQPGMPQQGPGGPMGGPVPPVHPGAGQPGGLPGAQPGGAQVPGAQGSMTPPISMGMAGAGQMPGLVNGLQLPQAGAFPAAQVPLPQGAQGAPLPQDLDGPNGQVQPVAESSPLLTGVRGLPAVGAAVGVLLGLLWLQRRIQRRRRSRHVL